MSSVLLIDVPLAGIREEGPRLVSHVRIQTLSLSGDTLCSSKKDVNRRGTNLCSNKTDRGGRVAKPVESPSSITARHTVLPAIAFAALQSLIGCTVMKWSGHKTLESFSVYLDHGLRAAY